MRNLSVGITLAVAVIAISPARAQTPSAPQWAWPQQAYVGPYQPVPLPNAITPGDAYKQGLINRWELERYEGPTPQALQGPSPDGGNQGGGDRNN